MLSLRDLTDGTGIGNFLKKYFIQESIMKSLILISIIFLIMISTGTTNLLCSDKENAISFQPLGFFFMWSNIEYERYISSAGDMAFTISGRIVLTTTSMGLSIMPGYFGKQWKGIGFSGRFYEDKRKMVGPYLGVNLDYLSGSAANQVFSWLGVEVGRKWTTGKDGGLFATPSLIGYIALVNHGGFKSVSGYAGVAAGYQF